MDHTHPMLERKIHVYSNSFKITVSMRTIQIITIIMITAIIATMIAILRK